ncbi:TPA: restriction endonuclease subunit S [Escherichia coli]|nr:restriction endonuclease subunit S [Escherichia coli]HBJ0350423.1 restriction endonuclease subunit S [Escherichia coli]HBJ0365129.1 restriction endonuclease subunit S [Escherichia coli]HBJ0378996.1 restriction endonuclease subunit S [Escherichia coli]HBJ1042149.1 restriction endonuclease subunit S [Escherichia coli]
MSELSYLEKLLDGVEVEWKPLKDVCDFKNGFAFKSSLFKETGLPIVRITNIDGFNVDLDEVKYFSLNDYKEDLSSFEVSMGNILIAMSGATTGKVGIYKKGTKCYLNQRVGKFIPKENILNNNYLYHFLLLNTETIYILAGGGAQPNLSSNALMSKLLIPIPCPDNPEKSLAIQSEIVRILDKFTALTAELTAELNMRKKQYNYYRDQLLNLEGRENTREMRIGDIYDFQYGTGNTIPKSGGQYPVYGSNGIVGSHDKYNSEDSPVIGHIGAYAGIVNWGQGKHFVTYNGVICRHKSKEVLQKYAYYLLLLQDFGSKSNSASQPFVSYNILNAPIVLVPPLQEQARIVAILDKFDTLTNSITEGLPREIELRQKQYEYYRDLLFSFPKPETVSN